MPCGVRRRWEDQKEKEKAPSAGYQHIHCFCNVLDERKGAVKERNSGRGRKGDVKSLYDSENAGKGPGRMEN